MGFLSPLTALLAAAITVPLLVSLYFLKLRRRQLQISSTLLWKKAIQDLQVNSPFQKLRKNLLLLLQLLILAALLFALARPTMQSTASPGQRVVIVIDHSASMNATDLAPTRLDEAKRIALSLIDNLDATSSASASPLGSAMIVSFAQHARVVQPFTGDLALLRQAVRSIEPTDQISHLAPALQLIEPFAVQSPDAASSSLVVYVLSDGRVQNLRDRALALAGAELRYLPIGKTADTLAADNLALIAFSARRDFQKPERVQIFARVANFSAQPISANLTLRIDNAVSRVQALELPAAAADQPAVKSLQFDFVLPNSALIQLSHDHPDALAADDTAQLTLAPARRLRVLLVSEGNAFLDRVINSIGVKTLVRMTPAKYEDQNPSQLRRTPFNALGSSSDEGFDLILFDNYSPKQIPPVNTLSFGASPPIQGLQIIAAKETDPPAQAILDWLRDHPLMRYVVLDDVILSQPARLVVPPDATILATSQTGPVIALLTTATERHVVCSFNILQSNWPLYVSFPVFASNAVQTLGLGGLADDAGIAYRTGDVAVVPNPAPTQPLTYAGPTPLTSRPSQGQALLPAFTRVGVYTADTPAEPPFDRLAVNLLDPTESDLRIEPQLQVGSVDVQGVTQQAAVRREVWRWFAWGALAVMLLEWLVYTRRMHL
jgi:Mg-chelatase subunit ChlD